MGHAARVRFYYGTRTGTGLVSLLEDRPVLKVAWGQMCQQGEQ